jgi:hypothetical protein
MQRIAFGVDIGIKLLVKLVGLRQIYRLRFRKAR